MTQSHGRRPVSILNAGRFFRQLLVGFIVANGQVTEDYDVDDLRAHKEANTTSEPETENENPALKETQALQSEDPKKIAKYKYISDGWRAAPIHHDPFQVELHFENLEAPKDDPFNTTGVLTLQIIPRWAWRGAHRFKELVEQGFYADSWCFTVADGLIQFGYHGRTAAQNYYDVHPLGNDMSPTNFDDAAQATMRRGALSFSEIEYYRHTKLVIFQKDFSDEVDNKLRPFGRVIKNMELLDRVHVTGNGPPEGEGPEERRMEEQGDSYIASKFPECSIVRKIVILGTTSTTTKKAPVDLSVRVHCETTKGKLRIRMKSSGTLPHGLHFLELLRLNYYDGSAFFHGQLDQYVLFGISPNSELREEWKGDTQAEDPHSQSECKEGELGFFGAKNSKTTSVYIPIHDDGPACLQGDWTPFADLEGRESIETLHAIYTDMGDKPDVGSIYNEGNPYLRKNFPQMDYITTCEILNDPERHNRMRGAANSEATKDSGSSAFQVVMFVGLGAMVLLVGGTCAFLIWASQNPGNNGEESYKDV